MARVLKTLNGPQEIGRGRLFWSCFSGVAVALLLLPLGASDFTLSNLSNIFLYVPMALGLALLWGHCGVLSFGQAAFFAISGYVYGILIGNLGDLPGAALLAVAGGIAASALLAGVFGYFVFYGQVDNWIVPLLLLVLSLILETFMGQTAGYQWRVGSVLLGGYNGMTGIPSLQLGPWLFEGPSVPLYLLVMGLVLSSYLFLRWLVNTHFGHIICGIRDDVERTRMLGYNVNLIQIQVFVLSSALAGLSGVLYVSWGNYVSPSSMGMLAATLPVIWVAVGGRSSLLAVLLSVVALRWLAEALAVSGGEYAFLIMGALLLSTMMFFPEGVVLRAARILRRVGGRGARAAGGQVVHGTPPR